MINDILARLSRVTSISPRYIGPEAAVLCLIYPLDGELEIILTLRSSRMRSHAGDVAFPGGKRDPSDISLEATARREAAEEINLPSELDLQHIATWPPYLSKNNLLVTPIIAYSAQPPTQRGWQPKANLDEVEDIFSVKLRDIHEGNGYTGKWMTWYKHAWRMHRFDLPVHNPRKVWGLTARILVDIARTAYGRRPIYDFADEIGDVSRIEQAFTDGVFGTEQAQELDLATQITGEGRVDLQHRKRGNI